jgi:hypothetical protein
VEGCEIKDLGSERGLVSHHCGAERRQYCTMSVREEAVLSLVAAASVEAAVHAGADALLWCAGTASAVRAVYSRALSASVSSA